jgi:hypothetical protein
VFRLCVAQGGNHVAEFVEDADDVVCRGPSRQTTSSVVRVHELSVVRAS